MMKTDSAELARITKHQRSAALLQNEVVMLTGAESCRFHSQVATHTKVNTEPILAGEDKKHLLSSTLGTEQFLPNEPALEQAWFLPSEDAFVPVQLYPEHTPTNPKVPAFAKAFDFGQLWHRGD